MQSRKHGNISESEIQVQVTALPTYSLCGVDFGSANIPSKKQGKLYDMSTICAFPFI
jgi:hypothetical protein